MYSAAWSAKERKQRDISAPLAVRCFETLLLMCSSRARATEETGQARRFSGHAMGMILIHGFIPSRGGVSGRQLGQGSRSHSVAALTFQRESQNARSPLGTLARQPFILCRDDDKFGTFSTRWRPCGLRQTTTEHAALAGLHKCPG